MRSLGREFLIFYTSSSEAALPRLIAKMEHLGVSKPVVGVTVPTGYSFNLDGTALYLTMASLFISTALGKPLSLGEQIGLLAFMIVASKRYCRRTWTRRLTGARWTACSMATSRLTRQRCWLTTALTALRRARAVGGDRRPKIGQRVKPLASNM
jgi:hypothetical protein